MSMSIDGFVAGPEGQLDWLFSTGDPESMAWTVASISQAGLHAMGRKTYRDMAAYWPTSTEPFAPPMNDIPKVVFTRTGLDAGATTTRALDDARAQGTGHATPSPEVVRSWTHPRVATGPLADELARLKSEPGKDIVAHGGSGFAQSLVELDLVDEYRLLVHPVVLGRGLPLFAKAEKQMSLELVELLRFPKGAVAHVYKRR
jgi:dihydrofolate reductase